MDEKERQKKIDFGRAKKLPSMPRSQSLASFRQKRAKGDGTGPPKKTEKRKGQNDSQNDSSTQDCCVDATPHSQLNLKNNKEETERTAVQEIKPEKDPSSTRKRSSSFVMDLKDEELAALTDKEQLKQLQQAVEKRNDIISKLSTNLQEALLSRDREQLEAQSLATEIQALQRQLQQTREGFLRMKNQAGVEVTNSHQQQPNDSNFNEYDYQNKSPDLRTESLSSEAYETEMDNVLQKLRAELEEERKNSQCICAKLAEEMEKNQHVISLLEKEKQGREEERKEKDEHMQSLLTQLSQVESQCLVMQQYKEEKEKLNREVVELRKRLQEEEDAERRLGEVKQQQDREVERLKEQHMEEIERVQQLLEDTKKELKSRENEVKALAACRNQEKAFCSSNETMGKEDAMLESGHDQVITSASIPGDPLMERYLSSVPLAQFQSSLMNESLDQCSELEQSFELNSDIFGDQPLLSISNRANEDDRSSQVLEGEDCQLESQWPHNSSCGKIEQSKMSEQEFEETDLGKELLYQQCGELHEELVQKDRDLQVLKEEISKTAEDLEEARSRWAQVTEELQHALWELEEEKAKRRNNEEALNLIDFEKDSLQKDKSGALLEKGERAETSLLLGLLTECDNGQIGELQELLGDEEVLSSQPIAALATDGANLQVDNQLKTLQCKHCKSELEEMKLEHQSTSNLLNQRSEELEAIMKELETTRMELVTVHTEMDTLRIEVQKGKDALECAEKENGELESQISCLKQNLEKAEGQSVKQREEYKKKEEEMSERVKQMEQVLEEELEQFENMLQTKDAEFAEEREKWEEEQQEKEIKVLEVTQLLEKQLKEKVNMINALMEKQLLAVEEAKGELTRLHLQEMEEMKEKHQQEVSALNAYLKEELLRQHVTKEEEQKRQISLIKQVNEREYERMMSELNDKHREELRRLKTEVTLELRESMEAAHQAELQQAQTQKLLDLEALRLNLSTVQVSQQEQESMRDRHLSEMEEMKRQNQEQQERLKVIHQQDIDELKQQWEALVEKQTKEIQTLKAQYETDVESTKANFRTSLSDLQNQLTVTQTELSSTQASLSDTRNSLNKAHTALSQTQGELQEAQDRLQGLQSSSKKQTEDLEEELKRALVDRDAAVGSLDKLVSTQKETEQKLLHLEAKERHLQQEVLHLQEEKTLLQQSSEQEVGQLWAQLESMRTSRQELGELKEQLMERSSRVNDIERLKVEFNEQKQEIKEQNEAELESLRRYFEKRLHATEESYREEIALLQLRLVEGALEDSLLITTDYSSLSHVQSDEMDDHCNSKEEKGKDAFESLRLQLEEKQTDELSSLQSSLTISFKEELQQVRSDLTDHYYDELQELKNHHSLDQEQLRAKLSDSYLKELTRVRLDAAQQVEAEVEQRIWSCVEELYTAISTIHNLETRLVAINKQHNAEMNKNAQKLKQEFSAELINLEEALKREREHEQQNSKRLKEELCAKHQTELLNLRSEQEKEIEKERKLFEKALSEEREKFDSLLDNDEKLRQLTTVLQEQNKESLCQAQERYQQEKAALEQQLSEKYEKSMEELKVKLNAELDHQRAALLTKHRQEVSTLDAKHNAQLEALGASHKEQLAALTVELESKHNADLVALEAALNSKRERDIESLEGVFQKSSQVELEALEAELLQRFQNEKDELEKRMLGNMDTLESTYLKEVQTLRDEMVQLEESYRQTLNCKSLEHQQQMERHAAEHLVIKEDLRKELAQAHMDKFRAMAAELSVVHKTELAAQKESLDAEHCKALEIIKKQVLDVEQQHSTALQELSLAYASEKKQLTEGHQLQLQELKSISARELEACRRELEEESSRQRQHYLEEVELLRAQSEERLQTSIHQLKTDFENKKRAELEELRWSFSAEQEEKERSYTGKMSQLTIQLQQLDAVVTQLRAEVGCLQGELEGKRAEMETMDTLLQRRERESQEGGNLLKMLTDDIQATKEERHKLHHANEKLRDVLLEMLRSILATEELVGKKITARNSKPSHHLSSAGNTDALESETSSDDLELTHQLCESLLITGHQINPGGEEAALSACSRLRQTVDTLLELLNQANCQLEQTHIVHLSLEEKFSLRKEDTAQLLEQHKLLLEQLDQEAKQRSHLQLELHKAEGLLEGHMAEKVVFEESLQQKEIQEEKLAEELELLKVKLHQMQGLKVELEALTRKHQELSDEHALLLRQKEHLSAGLGEKEKALLAETERLSQDRLDLERQAEKDHNTLSLRLRTMERELEEHVIKGQETEQYHKTNTEDLIQQVQALEKQLKNNRQFIEEQAVEREHERDEFQQEICRLEAQLRQTASVDNKGHKYEDLVLQVESLQAAIKDKSDDHASLITANQQIQRDLTERNEEIDRLAGRIRELEQALLNTAESNRSVSQLEQELHRAKLREQELTQDKQALEQQQVSSRLQISALQSKLDETKHCYHDDARDPTQELREALDTAQQSLRCKEHEVEVLVEQLDNVQRDLTIKEVELKHLTLQLELLTNNNAAYVHELQQQIAALTDSVSALTILQEEKDNRVNAEEDETLPSALLLEKNQEIDHLSSEIQRLEQELENAKDNKALEAEIEDLHSQVEHLQSEITRVRHDKREEEERYIEVISTLQGELSTLGSNAHEVSDSQDGDSFNPSPAASPEPQQLEQEKRWPPGSLKQELALTHSAPSSSLRSHLKALQTQLDIAIAEKEGLERLLITQEEEYRGHGEVFGERLKAEMEKAEELKGFLILKEAELKGVQTELEEEREKMKVTEEERDRLKRETEEGRPRLEDKAQLNTLVLELQRNEQDKVGEINTFKAKHQEMEKEMEVLRETIITLEKRVQEVQAEVLDMEKLISEEREEIQTLQTVKEELFAEREALRRREGSLQEEIEKLRLEGISLRALIQELTGKLDEKESCQEEAQKEVLTNAEVNLTKADTALREKESEVARLTTEHHTLRTELNSVHQALKATTERAESLHQEAQTKDRALLDLENDNQRLKAQLESLQEDVAVQEEELAHQQRELEHLHQRWDHWDRTPQHYTEKGHSHSVFQDIVTASHNEVSLSSPEVLRKMETSDRIPEQLHASVLGSRLSEFSAVNISGLDLPLGKLSPQELMESRCSRTITPDPASHKTHSTCARTGSENFSVMDSLDPEKDLEELDLTTPSSILGSTSSISAAEWASDGYGSNVSSELGARLRVELEQTERLDAQFVEYLRCRGMNPTNTDSAAGSMSYSEDLLSPELQGLLKKVFQESCRILTLSQRRTAPSTQPHVSDLNVISQSAELSKDCSATLKNQEESLTPMGWQQEKRALQETVIALRELLCRMAQRRTQGNSTSERRADGNWNEDQLKADERVESQIRVELQESQKQLRNTRDALQEQDNKILSLRKTVEECEEALRREQNRVQELHQELEQERALNLRKDRENEERREVEHVSSEKQRTEVMSLMGQMEQERVVCSNLRQDLQIEQSRSMLLEKSLAGTHKELEEELQRFGLQQELGLQENTRLERLLTEAESRLADGHAKLSDAHRRLDEERERWSKQVDELSRRHEADAARDTKFISDLRSQLEHERRQGEELAVVTDQLRAQLLQNRRKWEEEDHIRRTELQRENVAMEMLKERNREVGHSLELERELTKNQGVELEELKNQLRLMKQRQREREEEWERQKRKERQEQKERERRQERTKNKLRELEFLRQQDQQRMQELQCTVAELERDEREMAAQRLGGWTIGQQNKTSSTHHSIPQSNSTQASVSQQQQQQQQKLSSSQSNLLENLVKENSELLENVTSLNQERNNLKVRLAQLERRLSHTESELAQVTTATESRPVNDFTSNGKLQRLYERYLRAESFRKALVYQKRYLLLVLGGFHEGEQATLRFIAYLGALPASLPCSQHRPIGRFRAVVLVVVAVSRMKFLTRKWQKAIRRLSSGVVNGHSPGPPLHVHGPKHEVLRQQLSFADQSLESRHTVSALIPPSQSPFRLHNRSSSKTSLPSVRLGGTSQDPEQSLTQYIQHIENVQQQLAGSRQVNETPLAPPPNEGRRIQSSCSPDMIGYRQRWLQENRTWLYLSCLSPLYLNSPGSSDLHPDPK